MLRKASIKSRSSRVLHFFPFKLVLLHLKRNHLILLLWVLFFGFISGSVGTKYGIPNLFLYPEYLGEVKLWSFGILGFSTGGFIMAFNIFTYVLHAFRFRFIATLSRPFLKFSINNSLIPLFFIAFHIYHSVVYQYRVELEAADRILFNMGGYLAGIALFLILSYFYFVRTNKDIYKILGKEEVDRKERFAGYQRSSEFAQERGKDLRTTPADDRWQVITYLANPFRIKLARSSEHYEEGVLNRVFFQNHLNASIFNVVTIVSFIVIGAFREYPVFTIPAGAIIFLLFTLLLALGGAFHSWFRGWHITMLIGAVLLLNYLSIHSRMFGARTEAYGLDYTGEKKEYRQGTLDALANDTEAHKKDKQQTLEMLHKWRRKNISWNGEKEQKPKLVLLNASGGGSRSALWTFSCLQYADSALNGELMKHIPLITGSSGGMIGASYFRELYLKKMHNSIEVPSPYSDRALANISKDLLNPVALSIATNDLFIRYQEFNYGKFQYTKDRGYAFERGLIQNTEGVLDKRLGQYTLPVQKAQVPMMIFSPTVVQDGRRFLISSLPVSYMMDKRLTDIPHAEPLAENIDFTRFFREQGARNIRLTSILRMNASFPYILPFTTMPTKPSIELMDSGLRDNYGLLTSLQFMHKFRDWIRTNTSGVVILKLRDKQKTFDKIRKSSHSMLERLVTPMGSLYGNLFNMQDLDQDQLLQHAATGFDAPLDVVTFQLRHDKEDRISLSLHLTALEKRRIKSAVRTDENQAALKRLKKLLGEEKASASH